MKALYISPEAIKVNFEVKDIITASGDAFAREENGDGQFNDLASISWNDIK